MWRRRITRCPPCGCRAARRGAPSDSGGGLSVYRPGGTAEPAPTREETVYVVLDGELVVTVDGAETVLGWLDSVHLAKGELRSIHNRTDRQALLLVTVAHPVAEVA